MIIDVQPVLRHRAREAVGGDLRRRRARGRVLPRHPRRPRSSSCAAGRGWTHDRADAPDARRRRSGRARGRPAGRPDPRASTRSSRPRRRPDTVALQGIDLDIRPGEFVSLIGPSGCGKSTLLRVIGDLVQPTPRRGRGQRQDRRAGPPRPRLRDGLPGAGAVRLAERRGQRQAAARDPGQAAGTGGRSGRRRCSTSSSSATSREHMPVPAVGRHAAAGRDRPGARRSSRAILLMDEPFGALDEMTRERMNDEVLRIWEQTGTTIVFVTHSIPEAVFLSSRVVVMSARPGRITKVVDVDLPRPRNEDVARDASATSSWSPRSARRSAPGGGGDDRRGRRRASARPDAGRGRRRVSAVDAAPSAGPAGGPAPASRGRARRGSSASTCRPSLVAVAGLVALGGRRPRARASRRSSCPRRRRSWPR